MTILLIVILVAMIAGVVFNVVSDVNAESKAVPGATTKKHSNKFYLIGAALTVVVMITKSMIIQVPARSVGIKITPSGVVDTELTTGWHLLAPWSTVAYMDKSEWVLNYDNPVATKDGMIMTLTTNVAWKIDETKADWIYSNIAGEDESGNNNNSKYKWIEENIISRTIYSTLNMEVRKFTPIEVYSDSRLIIQENVKKKLTEELRKKNLVLVSLQITAVQYPKEFAQALLNKKLAQEKSLELVEVTKQKQEELKQAEINKNIAIQQAEGEAKSLQIKGQSISNNPKIVELEWINKWNGVLPSYMMGNGAGVMMNIWK